MPALDPESPSYDTTIQDRGEHEVRSALAQLGDTGYAEVIIGSPPHELARRSRRLDLLVVGSRSHGPARRLLLGSTSTRLVREVACPLLGRRTARQVAARQVAIVDAAFRHRADRDAFAAAFAGAAPLPFVECHAPAAVLAQRAAKRDREPGHVSDANLAVATRERSSWEPLDEVAPGAHLARRTDRRVDETAVDLLALLDLRIARIGA